MRKILVLTLLIGIIFGASNLYAATAQLNQPNVSGAIFVGNKITVTANRPGFNGVWLKCVSHGDNGVVFWLNEETLTDSYDWGWETTIVCFPTSANGRKQISLNIFTFKGYSEDKEVPVLTFKSPVKKWTQVGTNKQQGTLIFNGLQYDSLPKYLSFPANTSTIKIATLKQDLKDDWLPIKSRVVFYFDTIHGHRYECIVDEGEFTPIYSNWGFKIWGVSNYCGPNTVNTSFIGYGRTILGDIIIPILSGSVTDTKIYWELAGPSY